MSSRGNLYRHDKLTNPKDEIRLLSLNTDDDGSFLSFRLEHVYRDEQPFYAALSYEWGDAGTEVEIKINGRFFLVRHNLWLFLSILSVQQRAGKLLSGLPLWIDAVCINQSDLDEKSSQVAMMAQTFQGAVSVYAWLGWPTNWRSDQAFDIITKASEAGQLPRLWQLGSWDAVLKMCRCSYWSRRWILQEIVLAHHVLMLAGNDLIAWHLVQQMFENLPKYPSSSDGTHALSRSIPFKIAALRLGRQYKESTLLSLLEEFRSTECEINYDRIYSLLSLASDGDSISVNYSATEPQLFTELMRQENWPHRSGLDWRFRLLGLQCNEPGIPARITMTARTCVTDSAQSHSEPLFALEDLQSAKLTSRGRDIESTRCYLLKDPNIPCSYQFFTTNNGNCWITGQRALPGDLVCEFTKDFHLIARKAGDKVYRLVGSATLFQAQSMSPQRSFRQAFQDFSRREGRHFLLRTPHGLPAAGFMHLKFELLVGEWIQLFFIEQGGIPAQIEGGHNHGTNIESTTISVECDMYAVCEMNPMLAESPWQTTDEVKRSSPVEVEKRLSFMLQRLALWQD